MEHLITFVQSWNLKLIRKDKLLKLKRKNRGNIKLSKSIEKLINDIEKSSFNNKMEILEVRPDADRVHNDDFFFFDINVHRTLLLIVFTRQFAEIVWAGNHAEYDQVFKGNKKSIEQWLRSNGNIK